MTSHTDAARPERTSRGGTLTTGLMLFALFFGAGNLIFPPVLGASADDHLPAQSAALLNGLLDRVEFGDGHTLDDRRGTGHLAWAAGALAGVDDQRVVRMRRRQELREAFGDLRQRTIHHGGELLPPACRQRRRHLARTFGQSFARHFTIVTRC